MSRRGNRPRSALTVLNAAALSLPAIAQATAPPTEIEIGVATSGYREDDISSADVLVGSDHRYDIDINQFFLVAPVGDDWSVEANATRETMSGASPWGTVRAPDGAPKLIMTGATIEETRDEVALGATRYYGWGLLSAMVIHSTEDDYKSNGVVLGTQYEFDNAQSVLGFGVSYAKDLIEPSDAELFLRPRKERKESGSLAITLSRIVNEQTILLGGVSATRHSGYLADPYKLRDVRPDERLDWVLSAGLRYFVDAANAAWHLDYRYYDDDWGVIAHTLDAAWYQNIGASFQVAPYLRYYTQHHADFFRFVDDFSLPLDVDQSSDQQLSSFGAFSGGIKLRYEATRWSLAIDVERYVSRENYGFDDAEFDHPAALDYNRVTLSWDIRL